MTTAPPNFSAIKTAERWGVGTGLALAVGSAAGLASRLGLTPDEVGTLTGLLIFVAGLIRGWIQARLAGKSTAEANAATVDAIRMSRDDLESFVSMAVELAARRLERDRPSPSPAEVAEAPTARIDGGST